MLQKRQETQQRLAMMEYQRMEKDKELRKTVITARELDPLPGDVRLYTSLGKTSVAAGFSAKTTLLPDISTRLSKR